MTDDLYTYDGNYYRHANPYAFPGTTVTDVKRAEESVVFLPSGTYAFGGGVHDGTFAMAGTHIGFYAFNFPWHYGFSSDLDLKKSWFFFDEGILCLGSGITCTDNQMVYTTIDNRKCHKNYTLSVDGKTLTLRTSATTITSPTVIHHAVFGSYGFFGDTTVKCHKNTAGEGFYELRIEHGKRPENEGYAYLMLPCMDEAKATEYMQNPPVKILKNTPEQSVVFHQTAKVMGYTFFEAGEYEAVKVENPCILMTHETKKGLVCNVSDATHMFTTLTLHFAGAYRLAEHDDTVTATKTQEGITITINTNGTIGKVNTFVLTPDA